MYVCICHAVTEQALIDLVHSSESVFQYAGIAQQLKSSHSCCQCLPRTREVIDEANKTRDSSTRVGRTTFGYDESTAGILIESESGDIPIR